MILETLQKRETIMNIHEVAALLGLSESLIPADSICAVPRGTAVRSFRTCRLVRGSFTSKPEEKGSQGPRLASRQYEDRKLTELFHECTNGHGSL
jgi:predicted transposase YbfD/YdcC